MIAFDHMNIMNINPSLVKKLNTSGQISITVQSQGELFHPAESYLLFEGYLLKDTGAVYADGDVVSLINNGVMFLFSNIKYELS